MRLLLLAAALTVSATPAHAFDSAEDRAWWGVVREAQDIEGNRDGIWENEDLDAGERGWFRGGVERPSKREIAAWRAFRDRVTGGVRVGTTGDELVEAQAVNAMARHGRRPSEFSDGFVKAAGRDVYVQRWDAKGEQRVVTVIVPGYTESTSDWLHVANRMNAAGSRVYVFDPPGQGSSSGRRGDMESIAEWTAAYRAVLARAQAENPGAKIVAMGHSTGGGVLLADQKDRVNGQVHTKGPDGLALSAPYLDMSPTLLNRVSGVLAKVPFANRAQLPPLLKLSHDELGEARLKQWQKATGAKMTLHFANELSRLAPVFDAWLEGETGVTIPVSITHGTRDAVNDPAMSRRFVERTPGARLTEVDVASHDLQHDARGTAALLADWERVVEETLGSGANVTRGAATRPAGAAAAAGGTGEATRSAGTGR